VSGSGAPKPTRSLEDLVVPRRPAGIPYAQGEDHDARALLTANGYDLETETLIGLLDSNLGILQAAAARALGSKGARAARPALEKAAGDDSLEETVRVQAAYALARMEISAGVELLVRLLELNPEATPAPLQAAGALAQQGDGRGFELVRSALESDNPVTAMVACKQLIYFAGLEDPQVGVYEAFRRALDRPEQNIVGEALAQLEALDTPQARALLGDRGE
jgi:HEAT repeat protein